MRVAIIGAGASGIAAVIKLREMGIQDITIFEKASDLGGTWRDNIYPGLTCDVPSHLYRYSFEPNPNWTRRYADGFEILTYLRSVATKYDVEKVIRYESEVTRAQFLDGQWLIETVKGNEGLFDAVITAVGILHHPVYPKIDGLDEFGGSAFHSARWNKDVSLKDKRVGIIGTGSTALQILPAIVNDVAKVSLFQRTAQWVMLEPNPEIPEEKRLQYSENPESLQAYYAILTQRFNDAFCSAVAGENPAAYEEIVRNCQENLAKNVYDPALREKLTPNYKVGCKRLVVSNAFYPAIQRSNAELVTDNIIGCEKEGLRTADGRLHPLDCLIFATGFDAHRFFKPMQVIGRHGKTLDDAWSRGNYAYRAIAIPDFPNWFMIGGPNSPIGNFSFLMTAERQLEYIMQLLRLLQSGKAREISPAGEATAIFNNEIKSSMEGSIWASGCRSWYLDKNGNVASWPWSYARFEAGMRSPALEDFVVV